MALSIEATKAAGTEMGDKTLNFIIIGGVVSLVLFLADNQTSNLQEMFFYMFKMIIGLIIILLFIKLVTVSNEN